MEERVSYSYKHTLTSTKVSVVAVARCYAINTCECTTIMSDHRHMHTI